MYAPTDIDQDNHRMHI